MFCSRHAERLVVAGDTVSWGERMEVGGGGCMGGWKTLINPDLSRATNQRRRKTAAVGPQNATSD